MKGSNKMELNHATLNEAVEYWLNQTQFIRDAAVEVSSIGYQAAGTGTFKVNFKPVEAVEDDV